MKKTKAAIAYIFFGILVIVTLVAIIWAIDQTAFSFAPALGIFVGSLVGGAITLAIVYLGLKTLVQWIREAKEE